jgi:hypothetical protein
MGLWWAENATGPKVAHWAWPIGLGPIGPVDQGPLNHSELDSTVNQTHWALVGLRWTGAQLMAH